MDWMDREVVFLFDSFFRWHCSFYAIVSLLGFHSFG